MNQDRLIRLPEVIQLIGIGKSTVWLWVSQKRFPEPIRLSSRTTVWKLSEINHWIESRDGGAL